MKKNILTLCFVFGLIMAGNLPSNAVYCNSPCPDPCASSRTVCEGTNCTTYCNVSNKTIYSANYYTAPGVSFSYSTPNISFSISNEVYGFYNLGPRPRRVVVTNGFRPVYHHKNPPKPVPNHHIKPNKPNKGPVHHSSKGPKRA